jgi:hypothetical protein
MKKRPLLITFLAITLTSLVSAGPIEGVYQLTEGLSQILYILFQFIADTILQINSFDEFLFAKLILFVIVLLIVYTVLKKNGILGDKEVILWIISISISILSIRFIPTDLVEFALLQYGALGAGIAIFFPFMIFLFFLHQSDMGSMPRKIGWIFFGVSYIAIWAFRQDSLSEVSGYLYLGGILAIALAFIFDRQIHARFGTLELQKSRKEHEARRYTETQAKITDLENKMRDLSLPVSVRKANERSLKYLRKELRKIMKTL